jgi:hypothetical protein
MRSFAPSDLSTAARMLLALPEAARQRAMTRLIGEAEAADRYRKRLGRAHPLWGNGSLEAAARRHALAPQQRFSDTDYMSCMALALDTVLAHRLAQISVGGRLSA